MLFHPLYCWRFVRWGAQSSRESAARGGGTRLVSGWWGNGGIICLSVHRRPVADWGSCRLWNSTVGPSGPRGEHNQSEIYPTPHLLLNYSPSFSVDSGGWWLAPAGRRWPHLLCGMKHMEPIVRKEAFAFVWMGWVGGWVVALVVNGGVPVTLLRVWKCKASSLVSIRSHG